MVRAGRRKAGDGRRRGGPPRSQKVTARFSDDEYQQLTRLSKQRGERLSSLVRSLVVETVDAVRENLKKGR